MGLLRDVVGFGAAIDASKGAWPRAWALLGACKATLSANAVTCNAAVSACEPRGLWQQAASLPLGLFLMIYYNFNQFYVFLVELIELIE